MMTCPLVSALTVAHQLPAPSNRAGRDDRVDAVDREVVDAQRRAGRSGSADLGVARLSKPDLDRDRHGGPGHPDALPTLFAEGDRARVAAHQRDWAVPAHEADRRVGGRAVMARVWGWPPAAR